MLKYERERESDQADSTACLLRTFVWFPFSQWKRQMHKKTPLAQRCCWRNGWCWSWSLSGPQTTWPSATFCGKPWPCSRRSVNPNLETSCHSSWPFLSKSFSVFFLLFCLTWNLGVYMILVLFQRQQHWGKHAREGLGHSKYGFSWFAWNYAYLMLVLDMGRFLRNEVEFSWVHISSKDWDVAQLVGHRTSMPLRLVRFPMMAIFLPESAFSADSLAVSIHPYVQSHALTSVRTLKIL